MRKIVVPQEAVKRHEETLGVAMRGYLSRLAEGKTLLWNKKEVPNTAVDFWKWLYEQFVQAHILTAKPLTLLTFAKEYAVQYAQLDATGQEEVDTIAGKLFSYDSLRGASVLAPCDDTGAISWVGKPTGTRETKSKKIWDSWNGWSLAEYVRLLDVRYCPYCNAETVGLVQRLNPKSKTAISYSALDHVLPKSDYPFLALSLYNLVPACTKCNSQFKGEKDDFDLANWDPAKPFNAFHPYAHNLHKWFRFTYRPTSVANLFLDAYDAANPVPLAIENCIPLAASARSGTSDFYAERLTKYLQQNELPGSYYDLYAEEINAAIRMEMICSPGFVAAMQEKGLSGDDFDCALRRTSLDPRDVNRHRFAKLIIDLHQQLGLDELATDASEDESAAWQARKRAIAARVRAQLNA